MAEKIEVYPLSEGEHQWLVIGTTDAQSADEAVRQFVEKETGATIEALLDADDLVELAMIRRDDLTWWPADPKGNRVRGSALRIGLVNRSQRMFSGFLVEA